MFEIIGPFLDFVTTHSEAMIAVSLSMFLLLCGTLIYLNQFVIQPPDNEADFAKIEASIEKLLSKADLMKAAPAAAGPASASDVGVSAADGETVVSSTELLELEADLAEKKREVEKLKEQVESGAGGAAADDNTPELLAKISNLEDRLAEYEIIEDDIADLSHYKEENAKLKKQLEEGGAAPAAEEEPAPEASGDDGTEKVVQAKAEPEPEFPVKEEVPFAEAKEKSDDEDIAAAVAGIDGQEPAEAKNEVVEFSKAVEDLETQKEEAAAKVAEAEKPEEEAVSDDVFAEMTDSGDESDDPLAALGDIDTNKMLEELQGLEADANASAEVLEEQTDIDKMADEAKNLEKKS